MQDTLLDKSMKEKVGMAFLSTTKFDNFEELFCHQIEDLYDAEKRLLEALPKMADASSSPQLKDAFRQHLKETQGQVNRLEQIFEKIGKTPQRETCEAMKGLIKEGQEMIDAKGDPEVKDAALVAAAQRVEHYEISGYGTARNFAQRLGHQDVAQLLQETLEEEKSADSILTNLAERSVNPKAASR
jgi:ferritin-like metal-binding protein YciE